MVVSSSKSVMNAPVLRRLKKSNSSVGAIPTFRVVVFGQSGVGKTAMSVRFVTKRFIGEYDPTLENIYQHHCIINGSTVLFEIMDTAGQEENDLMMEEKIRWADAFLLVYAINDQTSFDEITRLKFTISHTMSQLGNTHKQALPDPVITIIGNKTDLEPDRMVDREDGEGLARSMNCGFREISVRDGLNEVYEVFEEIHDAYKYRITVFHAFNDSNGTIPRRKHKSFKYVDRIPRMQGKRYHANPFQDLNNRHIHTSDVAGAVMTSKIDEDSDRTEHGSSSLVRAHSHNYTRSTLSLPAELSGGSPTGSPHPRRPLRRRNAVIGLGGSSSSSLLSNDQSSDEDKQRRPRQLSYGTGCIPEGGIVMHALNYDSNNNTSTKNPNRRCSSQESFKLNSRHPLESMGKTAVSFDTPSGMSRRIS